MYLSKYGFVINKSEITESQLAKLKRELQAVPLTDPNFKTADLSFPVFTETKTKIYIPKMYGKRVFKNCTIIEKADYIGKDINLVFKGELLQEQITPIEKLLTACREKGGGILSTMAGSGKTVMALNIISQLKKKTLIIVNKISLLDQWKIEIQKFLPDAKIGIIQGNKCQVKNNDIIIGMLQSLAMKEYPQNFLEEVGLVINDECHNVSSKIFSQVLFKTCSYYTIGLSASPNRSDNLEYVFKFHLGDIEYQAARGQVRSGKEPIVRAIKIKSGEYREISSVDRFTGKKRIQFTSMMSDLVQMKPRNKLICDIVIECLKEGRKILVLSERRVHLETLQRMLQEQNNKYTYGLFLGGMKSQALESAKGCNVVLATFASFSEGVSEKDLDTLVLCTPKKFVGHLQNSSKNESGKMLQITGRIFRKTHTTIAPLIVDLQDQYSVYKNQSASRSVFYKQEYSNAVFESVNVNLDNLEFLNVKIQ